MEPPALHLMPSAGLAADISGSPFRGKLAQRAHAAAELPRAPIADEEAGYSLAHPSRSVVREPTRAGSQGLLSRAWLQLPVPAAWLRDSPIELIRHSSPAGLLSLETGRLALGGQGLLGQSLAYMQIEQPLSISEALLPPGLRDASPCRPLPRSVPYLVAHLAPDLSITPRCHSYERADRRKPLPCPEIELPPGGMLLSTTVLRARLFRCLSAGASGLARWLTIVCKHLPRALPNG